jgi:3-oxoadipate enol-lactonase
MINEIPAEPRLNWVRTERTQTVLLIHAVGFDLTYWDRQIECLQADYNVVAFDLPGHGSSTGGPLDCSSDQNVGAIADFIETAIRQPVHLVGLSFGGMIAQATVLARPELIRSLTFTGTASMFSDSVRSGMRTRAQATASVTFAPASDALRADVR